MSKQSKKQFDQLLNLLHELNIQRVDSDFVEDLWRGEIDEDNITAPKITEETLTDVLTEITSNKYLPKEAATPSSVGRLWTLMTEREMPPRNLVALLYQIIRSSKNSDLSFLAAHIYIAMLQLPGSNVYNVFNPFVFRTVLNLVREWTVRGNSKKRKQKNFFDEEIEEPKEEMEVEDEEDDKKQDQSVNIQRVIGLLETMKRLFVTYAMDNHQESVINAVEVLSEATRYTYDDGTVKKKRARTVEHPESVVKMWDHCYSVLKSLLHPMHGATEHNLGIVFKHLLGNVLLTFDAVNGASVPKTYHAIRTKALGFIKRVVESEPEDKQVSSALQVLLQYVCMRAPEKAEYRHLAAKSINELFDLLHNEDKTRFIRFVDKYSKNKKTNYRMFAVETALEMINDKAREESLNESQQGDLSSLLNIIMARSCDKLVGIRSKALSAITSMLDAFETYGPFKQLLMATFTASQVTNTLLNTPGSVSFATPPNSNSPKTPTAATPSTPNTTAQSPATPVTPSTPGQSVSLWTLLARRAQDPKCAVRRSAVTALAALGAVTVPPAGPTASLLAQRAADPSRAVRRAALGALGSFAAREGGAWSRAWVVAAWPRACDTEASVAAQVLNDFTAIVIDRVISNYQDDTLWQLIEDADQPSSDMGKYMQKICALLAKEKKLPRKLVTNLEHAITKTSRRGPWILLAYVAPFCAEQITHKLVADRWNKLKSTDKDEFDDDKVKVLRILSYIVGSIDSSLGEALFDDLLRRLEKFNHKPILIQNYIQTLSKLSQRQQSNAKNAKVTYPWAKKLLETCDEALARIVLPAAGANAQSSQSQSKSAVSSFEALERYLFTVGELAQLCPESISKRLVAVIQTLISPSLNLFDSPVPHSLTAHAFVSLGKLCLNDPALAKQCVAVFAKELHTSPHPTVRNNVMVIMCDLCIRYPSLVDNYIPSLTLCLRDENELVRRQTLVMLTQLIQEDFIKWKSGSLLFRFVLSLVDDSQNVRDYARVCLETLITKNSNVSHMFYLQFIETIFCLNDYRLHTTYNQYPQSEKERILFSLKGSGDNKDKRMSIYTMFLEHMSDDEKFNLTSKLCLEVLGGVVEGKMALQQAQHVLSDALSILTSKEIKLGATTTKDEDIDEDENPEAQKLADAKGKILSKLVKKNVMENIVPIVLELKQLLETNRSPLLGNLIEYLKDLMKEYKDEVEEILVDKKLIKELEYELRQFKPQTVTAFKSPAPPSATKQVPMASPRPVISASPKGRPSLANFAVPKLRKRVSLALASYTPSPARKNVSDVRRALLDEEKPEGVEKDVETENKSEEPVFRMPTTPFRGGAQSADLRMPPLPSPGRRDWPTLRRPRNTSSPTKEDSRPQSEEVPEEPKIAVKRQGTKRKAPEAPSSPQAPVSPVRKRAARGSASSESTANSRKRKRETTVKETTGTKKNTRKKAEDSDEEISDLSSDDDVAANDKAASDDEISDVSSDEEEKENKSNVNKTTKARGAAAKAKSKAPVKTTTRAAPARRTTRKVRDD